MNKGANKRLSDFLGDRWVMVVEPSSNYRTSIKQFLTNLKVKNMKLVGTVAEARRDMLTNKIGLFIVEWGLDEINGLQFCRALRKEPGYKDAPFLLLSTENLKQDVILASEVKIDGYLLKPFSYEDFCTQIQTIMKNITNPSRGSNILDLAEEKIQRGELDQAEVLLAEAETLRGRSARGLTMQARLLHKRGDPKGAMAQLKEATRINPDYIEAYRSMLEIAESTGDRTGIIQAASVLNSLSPENPRYTLVLAKTYLELSHFEGSEQFFKKTLSLSPKLAEAYKGLGNVHLAQDEYEKALKNFKKALDLDSEDISTLNSLGTTYVRMGQYKEGIDKYLIALKLDPHDARVLFNLGHAYEKKGDLEKAKWYYAQSLIHKAGFDKALRGMERVEKQLAAGRADPLDEPEDISGPSNLKKSG